MRSHQNNPCKLSLCVCAYVDIIFFFVFFFCFFVPHLQRFSSPPPPPHSALSLSLSLFPLCLRGDCEAQEPLRADKSKHHTGEINLELCVTRFDPAALSESLCLMRAARETKPILTPANYLSASLCLRLAAAAAALDNSDDLTSA